MGLVQKTFSFAADAEGLADAGNHANVTFAHESGDGDPSGCVKFSFPDSGALSGAIEYARRATTGQTFETWGVPGGSEIVSVQLTAWKYKKDSAAVTAQTLKVRLIDETGFPIHSGELLNVSLGTGATGWLSGSAGSDVPIDFLYEESTQDVRLELELTVSKVGGAVSPNETLFDEFELTITYDDGLGGSSVAVPIQNLDGLIFMKGFAYASRVGGVSDAIQMGALQECSIQHAYSTAEARGPESLQPLAVGIVEETLSGSIRHLVLNTEQLLVFTGGSVAYSGGTGRTTYTKLTDEEPTAFNLHLATPLDGSDMEVYIYNCLATGQPIVDGGANREFKSFGVDWRAYGQNTAQGKRLFQVILPGNMTGSS